MVASERGHWADAELPLRRALRLSPDEPRLNIALARSVRMQGRPREAIAFCQAALRAAPEDGAALLEIGLAQQESGALAEAEASYRHILKRGLEPIALVNLGKLLNGDGRADEAGTLLENALAQAPGDPAECATLTHQLGLTRRFQCRLWQGPRAHCRAVCASLFPGKAVGAQRGHRVHAILRCARSERGARTCAR